MKCDRNRGSPPLIYTESSKIKQLMRLKFVKCLHCVLLLFFTCMVSESDGAVGRKQFKTWQELDYRQIAYAIKDFALALPTQHFTLILDVNVDDEFYEIITELFREQGFLHSLYVIKSVKSLKMIEKDIKSYIAVYHPSVYFILTRQHIMEEILGLINKEDLIRRNLIYFFLWVKKPMTTFFLREQIIEAARVCVITNSKPDLYKVFYNQASSDGLSNLKLVNWWSLEKGLFRQPLLPDPRQIYKNFHRREFEVPVLHKPPWNFVSYTNDSIRVIGGRDDKLIFLLASKFKFRYTYIDPPERIQGAGVNGTMTGVLGMISRREVQLFAGDLGLTYERNQAVEFTFPTLADSEVFLTHSPGRLNEALALVRPFQWQVWLLVVLTVVASGPLLFIIIETPTCWQKKSRSMKPRNHWKVFLNCVWVSFTILLQQSIRLPSSSCRYRLVMSIFILSVVYVIGDMYSANLTSILAHPSKEQPISTLDQLADAMLFKDYQLLVEKQSSSHALLENGTGVYSWMWKKMKKQPLNLIDNIEEGMKYVKERRNYALLGGRETFTFDTRRFGTQHFHISEKLNTKYSAIAVQLGCPFLELFNEQLMFLYEAGILNKITEEEYQKLGESKVDEIEVSEGGSANTGTAKQKEDEESTAMTMTSLQGSFYVLIVGHLISIVVLLIEKLYHRYNSILIGYSRKIAALIRKKQPINKAEMLERHYRYLN
ncbi:unnamed protein product [Bemisia tabaci]|uniref:Ionotropic glutamate receptor C-terminal domain-containing protein n=1 Tax=Bemisia tabaci TaxID=7038 RepID=A0A9P0EYU1_BEMTA|nr:unnamed protein product [Bemisia tabaci]